MLVLLAAVATVDVAVAQGPGRTFRVGVLWSAAADDPTIRPGLESLRASLRESGYVEGQNLILEHRHAAGRLDRFPALAKNLVDAHVDVVRATSPLSIRAARQATSTVPIVMINGDPDMFGSLSRSGGNITGLTAFQAELAGKQVELLKEAVPQVSKIAVLRNPTQPVHALKLREAERVARALGVVLYVAEARTTDDFDEAFSAMTRERVGALAVFADGTYYSNRARIADLALRHRLPVAFGSPGGADAGGLMSYVPSAADTYRRAGVYVSRILKGAHPGDLPLERPTRFELSVNLRTAQTLRITLPQAVLMRADRVIE